MITDTYEVEHVELERKLDPSHDLCFFPWGNIDRQHLRKTKKGGGNPKLRTEYPPASRIAPYLPKSNQRALTRSIERTYESSNSSEASTNGISYFRS